MDILKPEQEIATLQNALKDMQKNIENHHHRLFEEAVQLSPKVGIQPSRRRIVQRQIFRSNCPASTPEANYKINLTQVFLDHCLQQLQSRFPPEAYVCFKGFTIVPSVLLKTPSTWKAQIQEFCHHYARDLPNVVGLPAELDLWQRIWTEKKEKAEDIPEKIASTLKSVDPASFPNILSEAVNGLKDRVIKQEDYSRRENLRILNIPENQGETNEQCCDKVKEVVIALGLDPNEISYHAIHRVGKQQQQQQQENLPAASSHQSDTTTSDQVHRPRDRPRPILVRFVSRMDADAVWGRRKELLQNPALSSVFIDKDLSAESAKIRGKLRAALRKSKELNISRAFIKGNKLFVNSSSYTVDNIPEYLLPSKHGNDH